MELQSDPSASHFRASNVAERDVESKDVAEERKGSRDGGSYRRKVDRVIRRFRAEMIRRIIVPFA
jgi:hypothetical protein